MITNISLINKMVQGRKMSELFNCVKKIIKNSI